MSHPGVSIAVVCDY